MAEEGLSSIEIMFHLQPMSMLTSPPNMLFVIPYLLVKDAVARWYPVGLLHRKPGLKSRPEILDNDFLVPIYPSDRVRVDDAV